MLSFVIVKTSIISNKKIRKNNFIDLVTRERRNTLKPLTSCCLLVPPRLDICIYCPYKTLCCPSQTLCCVAFIVNIIQITLSLIHQEFRWLSCCVERRSPAQYEGDLVTFVDVTFFHIMSAKKNIYEYERDVVMFVDIL